MGRTLNRFVRVYADGYDISGNTVSVGPYDTAYDDTSITGLDWEVQGAYPGAAKITMGTLNGIFDTTAASGLHVIASGAGVSRVVMNAIGIQASPAAGNPVFMGKFQQLAYHAEAGSTMLTATIPFGNGEPASMTYAKPWGVLMHAKAAETGANSGSGIDNTSATSTGGYMMYQIFGYTGSSGTATISLEDSADGITWTALSGATSGAINKTAMPCAGIVELSTTATVRRYLRWQLTLATLTGANFALAFVRG